MSPTIYSVRFVADARWAVPNPVGIDKQFEGLCPPYCADMRAAARKFADFKFGPNDAFDPERPGPYRKSLASRRVSSPTALSSSSRRVRSSVHPRHVRPLSRVGAELLHACLTRRRGTARRNSTTAFSAATSISTRTSVTWQSGTAQSSLQNLRDRLPLVLTGYALLETRGFFVFDVTIAIVC